ncbi:hypothetical protein SNEBB_002284 [Seison nebaliae]|nr:hypothetical protein SNEBB_002284 [Seison nebaliae]
MTRAECPVDWTNNSRISQKTNKQKFEKNLHALTNLKLDSKTVDPIVEQRKVERYLEDKSIINPHYNSWNILLQHLFFDPADIGDDEITGKILLSDEPPILIKGSQTFPIKNDQIENIVIYYPTIKMLHLIFPTELDNKYYKFDGTLMEYLYSTKYRLFNQKILEDSPWVTEQCNQIINEHGYPNVVITTLSTS